MQRDGDVVFAVEACGKALVASRRAGVSHRDDLFTHEMEPDYLRTGAVTEMASDRVADLDVQLVQRVGFREDRLSERARGVSPFRRFLCQKNQFVHGSLSLASQRGEPDAASHKQL